VPIPSVGRDVHYVSRGSADGKFPSTCRAAKVTQVLPPKGRGAKAIKGNVHLLVMNPDGLFFDHDVPEDQDTKLGGTWHWPERVGED
jgi:hypothetical protein